MLWIIYILFASAPKSRTHCCRYVNYLDVANDPAVDFQITNHNYFLADVLHRTDGVNVHRLAKKLAEQSDRLFARIRENVGNIEDYEESGCYPAMMDVNTSLNMKNIAGMADSIIKAMESSYAPERFLELKKRARWDLESVMIRATAFRNYENLICWVEDDGEGGKPLSAPSRKIWPRASLRTSGT